MQLKTTTPRCFGLLFDEEQEDCQACLVQELCQKATDDFEFKPETLVSAGEMPKGRKRIILAVCRKFGIPCSYRQRNSETEYTVTEAELGDYVNIDFLLTSKRALEILFNTKIEGENDDYDNQEID